MEGLGSDIVAMRDKTFKNLIVLIPKKMKGWKKTQRVFVQQNGRVWVRQRSSINDQNVALVNLEDDRVVCDHRVHRLIISWAQSSFVTSPPVVDMWTKWDKHVSLACSSKKFEFLALHVHPIAWIIPHCVCWWIVDAPMVASWPADPPLLQCFTVATRLTKS